MPCTEEDDDLRTANNNITTDDESNSNRTKKINKKNDAAIMSTAEDALLWKQRTHDAGYYNDPYLEYLSDTNLSSKGLYSSSIRQQQPMMRRGTYARVCCMDRAIASFLSKGGKQVIVLGAGKDTSCMRMRRGILTTQVNSGVDVADVRWYDVDLPNVIESKKRLLQLRFPEACEDNKYILKAWDLREQPEKLLQSLKEQGFDRKSPTLFVMECVLMYLPNHTANALLQCLSDQCDAPVLAIYDPILMYDRFGRVMAQHLSNARIMDASLSMHHTPTIQTHIQRLRSVGFQMVVACDMLQAYDTVISPLQRANANRIELLDELEEWRLIMSHYTFVVTASAKHTQYQPFVKEYTSLGPSSPLGFMPDHYTSNSV